ncbi:MAG: integrase [Candidimonas sp.]|nr:MAG: integrase [Candidimonas sp.]TAM80348.1 MAG: integrase [Candidimonas sp.]
MGMAGTRLSYRYSKFWYRHRNGKWEDVGTDINAAKVRAALYNDPKGVYGTTGYWLGMFIVDCEARVKSRDLAKRTVDGYKKDVEELKVFFDTMLPEDITPNDVQTYLDEGRKAERAVRANRERACLSSCLSWLIRTGKTHMKVNPCMRASGVQRNPETKRQRYVTDAEYQAVYSVAPAMVKLMMELVYRTLQRPEVDVLAWTPSNIKVKGDSKVLRVKQSKTGKVLDIGLAAQFQQIVEQATGVDPVPLRPLIHTREGKHYTYDGISSMLKRAQAKARKNIADMAGMPSFGFRDLKGKGATDMWLSGVPIERIQLLCGHANKATTETYIKARWSETATANVLKISA